MSELRHSLFHAHGTGRRIQGLTCDVTQTDLACVGQDGVTRIELSMEPGQMSMVPWFAVYEDDLLVAMVNGQQVGTVRYFRPDEGGPTDERS